MDLERHHRQQRIPPLITGGIEQTVVAVDTTYADLAVLGRIGDDKAQLDVLGSLDGAVDIHDLYGPLLAHIEDDLGKRSRSRPVGVPMNILVRVAGMLRRQIAL